MCAYNYSCRGGDGATAGRPRVRAGDIILVHAGLYRNNRYEYGQAGGTFPYEGTYFLTADGTPARPIVIKAAGDGEVIFDGSGNFALFNVMAADYTYFEGITFRNAEFAIWAGQQFIAGAKGLSVQALPIRGCGGRCLQQLFGLEQLLHRRQLVLRPKQPRAPDRLERPATLEAV